MTAHVPDLHFAGTASRALHAYRDIFGGEVVLHTFADLLERRQPSGHFTYGQFVSRGLSMMGC